MDSAHGTCCDTMSSHRHRYCSPFHIWLVFHHPPTAPVVACCHRSLSCEKLPVHLNHLPNMSVLPSYPICPCSFAAKVAGLVVWQIREEIFILLGTAELPWEGILIIILFLNFGRAIGSCAIDLCMPYLPALIAGPPG
jgi:hypothetical protein